MHGGLCHVHVLLEEVLILEEMVLLYSVCLRRLEELEDVTVHRPDGRSRGGGPHRAGQNRAGAQLGLAGQPVQQGERRIGGGWYQATNLRELLDDRFVLIDQMVEWNIVVRVTIIVQPGQKIAFLTLALGRN